MGDRADRVPIENTPRPCGEEGVGMTNRHVHLLLVVLLGASALGAAAPKFEATRIFIEYNSTDNDLGFHVFLDAENWKTVQIVNPAGTTIFEVAGKGAYGDLGLSELFTEGAEPTLDVFPLDELLALFPEGKYRFDGVTVSGPRPSRTATLSASLAPGPRGFEVLAIDASGNQAISAGSFETR